MLTETLVVSTLVSVVLVSLYLQFSTVTKNYEKSFNYNNVNDLYATYNIENFIKNDGTFLRDLKLRYNSENALKYLEILPDCTASNNNKYSLASCQNFLTLTNFYGIQKILFVSANPSITDAGYENLADPNLENFIKAIKNNEYNNDLYRIIVKFDNLEYASLVVAE